MTRRGTIALAAALLGLTGVLAAASPASAHASLESATPQQAGQLDSAPEQVVLSFTEPVSLSSRSVEVLDRNGRRVDRGSPRHPDGREAAVVVDLTAGLPKGSYAVVWRVVSADSHPVSGTYSFGVGVPAGAVPGEVAGNPVVGALHAVFRGVAFFGAMLLLGGTVFLVALWPAGLARVGPQRLVRTGWLASVVSAVALFLLQGPYGAGLGIGAVIDPALAGDTMATRYGKLMLLRLVVLAFAVAPLRRLVDLADQAASVRPDRRDPAPVRAAAVGPAGLVAVFVVSFSLSEHAGQGGLVPLWAGLDAVHLSSVAVWVGGLAVLGGCLLGRGTSAELAAVLPRWSRLAMVAVLAIVLTGTVAAWHEIGSWAALTGTEYGRLVLGKVTGLVVLLGLAELGRRGVLHLVGDSRETGATVPVPAGAVTGGTARSTAGGTARSTAGGAARSTAGGAAGAGGGPPGRHGSPAPAGGPQLTRLRAGVVAELTIASVVLVLTTLLVNAVPASVSFAPPYSATVTGAGTNGREISVLLEVDDTRVGRTGVHLYTYSSTGALLPFVEATGSLTERGKGLGPVTFTFTPLSPGHGTADGVVLPGPGEWTLTVQVRTDETTSYAATTSYPVR